MIIYFETKRLTVRLRYRHYDWNIGRKVVCGWYYMLGKRERGLELYFNRYGGCEGCAELVRVKDKRKFGILLQGPLRVIRYH